MNSVISLHPPMWKIGVLHHPVRHFQISVLPVVEKQSY